MHPTHNHRQPREIEQSDGDDVPPPPIEVFVIYDHRDSYRRAMSVLGECFADRPGPSDVCLLPWAVAELQSENWRDRALNDAAGAALLVISMRGSSSTPNELIEWLAACFTRRAHRSGKVMLIRGENLEEPPYESCCADLVRRMAAFSGVQIVRATELGRIEA